MATPSIEFIFPLDLYREEEKTCKSIHTYSYSEFLPAREAQMAAEAVKSLQQLCIVNTDCPISEKIVGCLVTCSFFKHSWELLHFIPGAHILEGEEEKSLVTNRLINILSSSAAGNCFNGVSFLHFLRL